MAAAPIDYDALAQQHGGTADTRSLLRVAKDSFAQQQAMQPAVMPAQQGGYGANIPVGYVSPDVIDRRSGQSPTLAERIRDLMLMVRKDYEGSQNNNQGPSYRSPIGPNTP